MTKLKHDNEDILSEFLYRDKFIQLATFIGSIIVLALISIYHFPVYIIYIFVFLMMAVALYRYIGFVKSKNIKSTRTKAGVLFAVGDKKWFEPKKYFLKVGIFLVIYSGLVILFYWLTRLWFVASLLLSFEFALWGWFIKNGIVRKK